MHAPSVPHPRRRTTLTLEGYTLSLSLVCVTPCFSTPCVLPGELERRVDVARALLVGVGERRVNNAGARAASFRAGLSADAPLRSRAAIRARLAAAP